jgi:hypothetical protein
MGIKIELSKIFTDESKWTQSAYARDNKGEPVSIFDNDACAFCINGGITRYAYGERKRGQNDNDDSVALTARNRINRAIADLNMGRGIIGFNDNRERTFEDVVKVLKHAGVW